MFNDAQHSFFFINIFWLKNKIKCGCQLNFWQYFSWQWQIFFTILDDKENFKKQCFSIIEIEHKIYIFKDSKFASMKNWIISLCQGIMVKVLVIKPIKSIHNFGNQ